MLAIVNTRKAVRELQRMMPADTLHLSALMCGAHRKDVKMLAQGGLALPMPGLYLQVDAENLYDPVLGLKPDDDVYNPGGFAI